MVENIGIYILFATTPFKILLVTTNKAIFETTLALSGYIQALIQAETRNQTKCNLTCVLNISLQLTQSSYIQARHNLTGKNAAYAYQVMCNFPIL